MSCTVKGEVVHTELSLYLFCVDRSSSLEGLERELLLMRDSAPARKIKVGKAAA